MRRTPDRTPKTGSDDLARVIRERREDLGLSRQELADATGIPYPTIAQIETAYRGVSPARLGMIARVLGLDPKELYEVLASGASDGALVAPEPTSPAAPSAAGHWHANQRFAAAAPAAVRRPAPAGTAPDKLPEPVEQIMDVLRKLPGDSRLDVLADVQRRVLDEVVQERVRSGG